jgi:hypothetical protein
MQEKARAEVIRILGNEPIIPSLDQLKVLLNHYNHLFVPTFHDFIVFHPKSYILIIYCMSVYNYIYIRN